LRTSGHGHSGNWIHTTNEYQDFRLRFEYKLNQWAEGAVILRAPRSARPQHAGLTLVLAHDFHNETTPYITGAIMGVLPPGHTFPASFERWHKVEIELTMGAFKASIDGIVVQDVKMDAVPSLRHRLRFGVIGFPDMGYAYALRNLELEDLGRPTKFVELLADRSLQNWDKLGDSGEWDLREGILEGFNGHSILYAPPVFEDFELTAVVRTHSRVNSGIFLRGQPTGQMRGFEIQIYSPVDAVYPTGSIYGRRRSTISADLEERWFLLQIRLQGSRCDVWIDGEPAATDPGLPPELQPAGRIGFQIHMEDTRVEFRDLRVRPL
jgi:hypothetical protein